MVNVISSPKGYIKGRHLLRKIRESGLIDPYTHETPWLEFKEGIGEVDPGMYWQCAKVLMALANSTGGLLIIGIREILSDHKHIQVIGVESDDPDYLRVVKESFIPGLCPSKKWKDYNGNVFQLQSGLDFKALSMLYTAEVIKLKTNASEAPKPCIAVLVEPAKNISSMMPIIINERKTSEIMFFHRSQSHIGEVITDKGLMNLDRHRSARKSASLWDRFILSPNRKLISCLAIALLAVILAISTVLPLTLRPSTIIGNIPNIDSYPLPRAVDQWQSLTKGSPETAAETLFLELALSYTDIITKEDAEPWSSERILRLETQWDESNHSNIKDWHDISMATYRASDNLRRLMSEQLYQDQWLTEFINNIDTIQKWLLIETPDDWNALNPILRSAFDLHQQINTLPTEGTHLIHLLMGSKTPAPIRHLAAQRLAESEPMSVEQAIAELNLINELERSGQQLDRNELDILGDPNFRESLKVWLSHNHNENDLGNVRDLCVQIHNLRQGASAGKRFFSYDHQLAALSNGLRDLLYINSGDTSPSLIRVPRPRYMGSEDGNQTVNQMLTTLAQPWVILAELENKGQQTNTLSWDNLTEAWRSYAASSPLSWRMRFMRLQLQYIPYRHSKEQQHDLSKHFEIQLHTLNQHPEYDDINNKYLALTDLWNELGKIANSELKNKALFIPASLLQKTSSAENIAISLIHKHLMSISNRLKQIYHTESMISQGHISEQPLRTMMEEASLVQTIIKDLRMLTHHYSDATPYITSNDTWIGLFATAEGSHPDEFLAEPSLATFFEAASSHLLKSHHSAALEILAKQESQLKNIRQWWQKNKSLATCSFTPSDVGDLIKSNSLSNPDIDFLWWQTTAKQLYQIGAIPQLRLSSWLAEQHILLQQRSKIAASYAELLSLHHDVVASQHAIKAEHLQHISTLSQQIFDWTTELQGHQTSFDSTPWKDLNESLLSDQRFLDRAKKIRSDTQSWVTLVQSTISSSLSPARIDQSLGKLSTLREAAPDIEWYQSLAPIHGNRDGTLLQATEMMRHKETMVALVEGLNHLRHQEWLILQQHPESESLGDSPHILSNQTFSSLSQAQDHLLSLIDQQTVNIPNFDIQLWRTRINALPQTLRTIAVYANDVPHSALEKILPSINAEHDKALYQAAVIIDSYINECALWTQTEGQWIEKPILPSTSFESLKLPLPLLQNATLSWIDTIAGTDNDAMSIRPILDTFLKDMNTYQQKRSSIESLDHLHNELIRAEVTLAASPPHLVRSSEDDVLEISTRLLNEINSSSAVLSNVTAAWTQRATFWQRTSQRYAQLPVTRIDNDYLASLKNEISESPLGQQEILKRFHDAISALYQWRTRHEPAYSTPIEAADGRVDKDAETAENTSLGMKPESHPQSLLQQDSIAWWLGIRQPPQEVGHYITDLQALWGLRSARHRPLEDFDFTAEPILNSWSLIQQHAAQSVIGKEIFDQLLTTLQTDYTLINEVRRAYRSKSVEELEKIRERLAAHPTLSIRSFYVIRAHLRQLDAWLSGEFSIELIPNQTWTTSVDDQRGASWYSWNNDTEEGTIRLQSNIPDQEQHETLSITGLCNIDFRKSEADDRISTNNYTDHLRISLLPGRTLSLYVEYGEHQRRLLEFTAESSQHINRVAPLLLTLHPEGVPWPEMTELDALEMATEPVPE